MALEIVWTEEASEGLDEIITYLERKWTQREIKKFFVRLEDCLEKICRAPHQPKDSLRKPGTKEYQHSPHTTIFYTYDDKVVNILRIWTNMKNPSSI
ncbi:type II toxin-antitoxin system RelE/ParE family toxin [Fulvivirga sediminis]|uniref:Type II toxin-antitoxin system RelE/ParE family toxin n=1 Tax=Fulvivirga sediminis TaxID=2803949 RepID=A0A937FA07_9BACT|nr:type II toxin-antitoxin system RelE/ParE family toxin [Fulvivirga sediminis]MBL3657991.1 type II toxin-antitoxin system RelE/ParE family toxin [Fulvivirga sediminis]